MVANVFHTPAMVTERHIKGRSVVVIDVLRACSTIVTALHNGATRLLPVSNLETAGRLGQNMDSERTLLGGERHGKKIEGFDLGNSPMEYTAEVVRDKTIIIKTTNGTDAILKGKGANHILVGSFLNAQATVDFILDAGLDVSILCAGWRGLTSYEDMVCAGLLLDRLWSQTNETASTDACRIAHLLFRDAERRLEDALTASDHGQRLAALGSDGDVAYCSQIDVFDIVARFADPTTGIVKAGTESAT